MSDIFIWIWNTMATGIYYILEFPLIVISEIVNGTNNSVMGNILGDMFGLMAGFFIPLILIMVAIGIIRIFLAFFPRNIFRHFFGTEISRDTRRIDNENQLVVFKPKEPVKIPEPEYILREDFFCQMDNDIHSKIDEAYQCIQCLRFVCKSCFDVMKEQGYSKCPYCRDKLVSLTLNWCLSKPLIAIRSA